MTLSYSPSHALRTNSLERLHVRVNFDPETRRERAVVFLKLEAQYSSGGDRDIRPNRTMLHLYFFFLFSIPLNNMYNDRIKFLFYVIRSLICFRIFSWKSVWETNINKIDTSVSKQVINNTSPIFIVFYG